MNSVTCSNVSPSIAVLYCRLIANDQCKLFFSVYTLVRLKYNTIQCKIFSQVGLFTSEGVMPCAVLDPAPFSRVRLVDHFLTMLAEEATTIAYHWMPSGAPTTKMCKRSLNSTDRNIRGQQGFG